MLYLILTCLYATGVFGNIVVHTRYAKLLKAPNPEFEFTPIMGIAMAAQCIMWPLFTVLVWITRINKGLCYLASRL